MCKGIYILLLGKCRKCSSVLQYKQHGSVRHFHCWRCNKPFGESRWKNEKHPISTLQNIVDQELQGWECANDFHNNGSTPLLNSIRKDEKYVHGTEYLFQMGANCGIDYEIGGVFRPIDVACNYGNIPAIAVCIKYGQEITDDCYEECIYAGYVDVLKFLIICNKEYFLEIKDRVLKRTIDHGAPECVEYLLDNKKEFGYEDEFILQMIDHAEEVHLIETDLYDNPEPSKKIWSMLKFCLLV